MEPSPAAHTLALTAHLLLFAWWLGGDLGVFYSSGRVVDASQPRAARLMIRRSLSPFVAGCAALASGRETPESDRDMAVSLTRMRLRVLAIWAGLVASAVLGVAKPGG